jgi:hypothetical protein
VGREDACPALYGVGSVEYPYCNEQWLGRHGTVALTEWQKRASTNKKTKHRTEKLDVAVFWGEGQMGGMWCVVPERDKSER